MTSIGFAPVNTPQPPKWGTPPINPDRDETNRSVRHLADLIRDKAPVIATILKTPVGCDLPEQGGINGKIEPQKNSPYICYLA